MKLRHESAPGASPTPATEEMSRTEHLGDRGHTWPQVGTTEEEAPTQGLPCLADEPRKAKTGGDVELVPDWWEDTDGLGAQVNTRVPDGDSVGK